MIRDDSKPLSWYEQWIDYDGQRIRNVAAIRQQPAADIAHEPHYVYDLAGTHLHRLLRRYCRGDDVSELSEDLMRSIGLWEESNQLRVKPGKEMSRVGRTAWSDNLDHYIRCFWLTGLALALDVPDSLWQRLVTLMGNEGEDALLDRVIATRQTCRRIGTALCHPRPYQRLLEAVVGPQDEQPSRLCSFVEHWYAELDRPPKPGLSRQTAMYKRPYWYDYDKAEGAYFGFWCIEAVAAVKAFRMDDTLCLGHPRYPGGLLHPDDHDTGESQTKPLTGRLVQRVMSKLMRRD